MTGLGFRAVLFDLDGTLIDSNAAHAESWTQALREAGYAISIAQVRPLIGMGGDKLLPTLVQVSEDSEQGKTLGARKQALFSGLLPHLCATRGARALLLFLRESGIAVGVATSSDERDMHALLEQARLGDLVPERASKKDAERSKPDPDIVQAALRELNVRASDAVFVGDTPYDVEAAGRAGVPAIALRCGGFWRDDAFEKALGVFDDPADLLAHWRRLA